MKRLLSLLCAMLLAACFSGCTSHEAAFARVTSTAPVCTTEAPVSDTPAPDVDDAATLLTALDLAVFEWYLSAPEATVPDIATIGTEYTQAPRRTWGDYSCEAHLQHAEDSRVLSEQLSAIDRSMLDDAQQLLYDTLARVLALGAESEPFYYFDEPLTPVNGVHTAVPAALMLYSVDSADTAEAFLLLLADTPRYFAQLLAFEQEKAELGMFMTASALDTVLAQIDEVLRVWDASAFAARFENALDAVGTLSEGEKIQYENRCLSLASNEFVAAYASLRDGLLALADSCRSAQGFYLADVKGGAYFDYALRAVSASDPDPQAALELLENCLCEIHEAARLLCSADASLSARAETAVITRGGTEENLAFLLESSTYLPALPAHELSVSTLALPAAEDLYAVWAASADTVYINSASADRAPLLALARETYGGRISRCLYQNALSDVGRTPRALVLEGYDAGWAGLSEQMLVENAAADDTVDMTAAALLFYEDMENALLCAIMSIAVNSCGYDEADVIAFAFEAYGCDASAASALFRQAVESPTACIAAGLGYAQLHALAADWAAACGKPLWDPDFFQSYLDYGPTYFDLVRDRMLP